MINGKVKNGEAIGSLQTRNFLGKSQSPLRRGKKGARMQSNPCKHAKIEPFPISDWNEGKTKLRCQVWAENKKCSRERGLWSMVYS